MSEEYVAKLEQINRKLRTSVKGEVADNYDKLFNRIDQLESQLEKAGKVIEFYACADNWFQSSKGGRKDKIFQGDTEHTYFTRCESNYSGGKRAREYFRNKEQE